MLHRHARPAVAGSYLAGATVGALLSATGLVVLGGLVSPIPVAARNIGAIGALMLLAVVATGLVPLSLPQNRRQIDREVFRQGPERAAFAFAFELGTGMRTYVTSPAPYGVAVVVVLVPQTGLGASALVAGLAAVGFGIGRSLVVVSHTVARRVAVDHPERWLRAASMLSLVAALRFALA